MKNYSKGKLIAGVGMPGCGKSTLLSEVAKSLGASYFVEPEEDSWDRSVLERDRYGHIGGLHWFRSQRVPNLYEARRQADKGELVFLDTFYDKLCSYYLGAEGMEWLLSPSDPYFSNFLETSKIDLRVLPEADILVFINVDNNDWVKMLESRGRCLDKSVELEKTFHTQGVFKKAAKLYCEERKATYLEYTNKFSTIREASEELKNLIKEKIL